MDWHHTVTRITVTTAIIIIIIITQPQLVSTCLCQNGDVSCVRWVCSHCAGDRLETILSAPCSQWKVNRHPLLPRQAVMTNLPPLSLHPILPAPPITIAVSTVSKGPAYTHSTSRHLSPRRTWQTSFICSATCASESGEELTPLAMHSLVVFCFFFFWLRELRGMRGCNEKREIWVGGGFQFMLCCD